MRYFRFCIVIVFYWALSVHINFDILNPFFKIARKPYVNQNLSFHIFTVDHFVHHHHSKSYWHTNVVYEGKPKCIMCTVSWAALIPKRSAPTACRHGPPHRTCRAYATCWMTVCLKSRHAPPVMALSAARSSRFFQVRHACKPKFSVWKNLHFSSSLFENFMVCLKITLTTKNVLSAHIFPSLLKTVNTTLIDKLQTN